jgi:hypothetical protein
MITDWHPPDYGTFTATAESIAPGARSFPVAFVPHRLQPGMAVYADQFHADRLCEVRRVESVVDGVVTVNAPFRYAHAAGTLLEIHPEFKGHVAYWNAQPVDGPVDALPPEIYDAGPGIQAANDDSDTYSGGGYCHVVAAPGYYWSDQQLYDDNAVLLEGNGPYHTYIAVGPNFKITGTNNAFVSGRRNGMVAREQGGPTTRVFKKNVVYDLRHFPGLDGPQYTSQQPGYADNLTIINCDGRALVLTGQQWVVSNLTILRSRESLVCQNMLFLTIRGAFNVESWIKDYHAETFIRFDGLPEQRGTGSGIIRIELFHAEGDCTGAMVAIPQGYDIVINGGSASTGSGQLVFEMAADTSGSIRDFRFTGDQAATWALRNHYNGDALHAVADCDGHIGEYTWGRTPDAPSVAAATRLVGEKGIEFATSRSKGWTARASSNTGDAFTGTADDGRALVGKSERGTPLYTVTLSGGVHHVRTIGGPGAAWTLTNGSADHTGTSEGTAAMVWNHERGQAAEFVNDNPANLAPVATFHQRGALAVDAVRIIGGGVRVLAPVAGREPQALYAVSKNGNVWFAALDSDGTARNVANVVSGLSNPDAANVSTYLQINVFGATGGPMPVVRVESRDGVPMFGVHGKCAPQAPALPPRTGRQTISREAVRVDAVVACLVAAGLMEEEGK